MRLDFSISTASESVTVPWDVWYIKLLALQAGKTQSNTKSDIAALYRLSFCAHYYLVTIHPWVDGYGRMSRLVMNFLQMEFGLVPSKILAVNKAEYIMALQKSREKDDVGIICDFLFNEHATNLRKEIDDFKRSMTSNVVIKSENVVINVVINDAEKKILDMLRGDSSLSAAASTPNITRPRPSRKSWPASWWAMAPICTT